MFSHPCRLEIHIRATFSAASLLMMETASQESTSAGAHMTIALANAPPITHLRTSLGPFGRSNLVKSVSAFSIIITCLLLARFVIGMPGYDPPVSHASGSSATSATDDQSGRGVCERFHVEKKLSVGGTLDGFEAGDEIMDGAPSGTASAEGPGSTIAACICTGLLGLIGYRLKRRCR